MNLYVYTFHKERELLSKSMGRCKCPQTQVEVQASLRGLGGCSSSRDLGRTALEFLARAEKHWGPLGLATALYFMYSDVHQLERVLAALVLVLYNK